MRISIVTYFRLPTFIFLFCQHYFELDMTKYQPSLYSNVEELAGMSQAVSLEAENTHL